MFLFGTAQIVNAKLEVCHPHPLGILFFSLVLLADHIGHGTGGS